MEQAKKESILSCAARAFARFGFKKASVEEIAREAGVAKGTVYLACDTKEDLFYQALHREVRAWTAELARLIDPRVAADQLFAQVAAASIEYMDRRPLVRDLLIGSFNLMLPEWSERLDELRELGRANCTEILRLGVKQGLFREDLDLEEVSKIIQDVMLSTYLFHLRGVGKTERIVKRVTTSLEILMNGIKARPKAGARP
jgi:AcrR family transcriptional regulator